MKKLIIGIGIGYLLGNKEIREKVQTQAKKAYNKAKAWVNAEEPKKDETPSDKVED